MGTSASWNASTNWIKSELSRIRSLLHLPKNVQLDCRFEDRIQTLTLPEFNVEPTVHLRRASSTTIFELSGTSIIITLSRGYYRTGRVYQESRLAIVTRKNGFSFSAGSMVNVSDVFAGSYPRQSHASDSGRSRAICAPPWAAVPKRKWKS